MIVKPTVLPTHCLIRRDRWRRRAWLDMRVNIPGWQTDQESFWLCDVIDVSHENQGRATHVIATSQQRHLAIALSNGRYISVRSTGKLSIDRGGLKNQ
jgi:hypothetical protein